MLPPMYYLVLVRKYRTKNVFSAYEYQPTRPCFGSTEVFGFSTYFATHMECELPVAANRGNRAESKTANMLFRFCPTSTIRLPQMRVMPEVFPSGWRRDILDAMRFYWELTKKDGTRIEFPPDKVPNVRKMWSEGVVKTSTNDIPADQIRDFRQTSKQYSPVPLLEDVARAFNEPFIEDESVVYKWVKKTATYNEWSKHYSAIPGYRKLGESTGMVEVAFRQPVHQIKQEIASICNEEEIRKIENT